MNHNDEPPLETPTEDQRSAARTQLHQATDQARREQPTVPSRQTKKDRTKAKKGKTGKGKDKR